VCQKGRGGFTLLELLVSMLISVILVLCLSLALRTGYLSLIRGRKRVLRSEVLIGLKGIITRQLENVYRKKVFWEGKSVYYIGGGDDSLYFMTLFPVHSLLKGGIAITRYVLEGDGGLYLYQWPYTDKNSFERMPEGIKVADGIREFSVRFLEDSELSEGSMESSWEDQWEPGSKLPLGMEVTLETSSGKERFFVTLSKM